MSGADVLLVLPDASPPLSDVAAALSPRPDVVHWQGDDGDGQSYGRSVAVQRGSDGPDLTVKAISPRLLGLLARHPAHTVVLLELDLAVVYAVLSRARHPRRRVVVLVEGNVERLGATGSSAWKVAFRRLVARSVHRFVANSPDATAYLVNRIGVPRERITEGWWLAGIPEDVDPEPPAPSVMTRGTGPIFLTVGRLTALKGQRALLRAAAAYTRDVGPCRVWFAGEGEDRPHLEALAGELGLTGSTTFLGMLDRSRLLGALHACDAFVFPTLVDLVGRALVEALATGTPVVVSNRSGAIGVLVEDRVNGIVVDPEDPDDLLRGLREVADPDLSETLRQGAADRSHALSVRAAAAVITDALQST